MNNIDIDLLNAFRLRNHGYDFGKENIVGVIPDDTFNAVAFAQSNDLNQFFETQECVIARNELITELFSVNIIGTNYYE